MLKKINYLVYLIVLVLSGCASSGPQQPNLTPLQIQLMQTKVFNVDLRTAFDATVTVMQNLGYIIQDANFNSGIITAKSTQTANFWGDSEYTEATAFIQPYRQSNKNSSIRINFVVYNSMPNPNQGGTPINTSSAILDPQAYENAFAKIQQQIFVQTGISPVLTQPIQQVS
ncbi:conserved hypothetical protein [Francisella tularensis subsp. novicida GA99-3548]|uniref:hypothetical protein n=1 Tax=Francisella tularensis TaxID=263 RepID=UPI000158B36F|nr:hypothetical protein [Francisella tularensis]AJI72490.1 hypothetical protein AQ14_1280 [Francisella tularensis subsp. novicida D9876]APA83555.1 hypothetical protein N894_1571 [Francisella tularensis subsp. novicida PA10-7858]EDN38151.1 conserved hypothetical protein [Francisella tularensis subsp. novicida GA99-3548]MBK2111652.1 hypothetical protein [Francisella tularensis subsp. novicida FSC159]